MRTDCGRCGSATNVKDFCDACGSTVNRILARVMDSGDMTPSELAEMWGVSRDSVWARMSRVRHGRACL